MFSEHHYLDRNLAKASRTFVGVWNEKIVAFGSSMTMPSGTMTGAWREHRTVILPDYQGMGMGVRFSDALGEIHLKEGFRYFSRTAHPRMGYYREKSPLWKGTSKNRKLRTDITHENLFNNHYADNKRVCFSHEYLGKNLDT